MMCFWFFGKVRRRVYIHSAREWICVCACVHALESF